MRATRSSLDSIAGPATESTNAAILCPTLRQGVAFIVTLLRKLSLALPQSTSRLSRSRSMNPRGLR